MERDLEYYIYLTNTSQVYGAGTNEWGQLCLGDKFTRSTPELIQSLSNIKQVSLGRLHSLFVNTSGNVFGCGASSSYQLGFSVFNQLVPALLFSGSTVTKVATGSSRSYILKHVSGGISEAYGTGTADFGALGINTTLATISGWTLIDTLPTNVVDMSAAQDHVLWLTSDGAVLTNGFNNAGQLGIGFGLTAIVPTLVSLGNATRKIATAFRVSMALDVNGDVWAWGSNIKGGLGFEGYSFCYIPARVSSLKNVTNMFLGDQLSVFVKSDLYYVAGSNDYGQVGNKGLGGSQPIPQLLAFSTYSTPTDSVTFSFGSISLYIGTQLGVYSIGNPNLPMPPTPLWQTKGEMVQISTNYFQTLFLSSTGSVWGSGVNYRGSLGLGNGQPSQSLTQIPNLAHVTQVSANQFHSLVLVGNDKIFGAGDNSFGALGLPDPFTYFTFTELIHSMGNITQVYAGQDYTLFVATNGSVYGCGKNKWGQLSIGSNTTFPVENGVYQLTMSTIPVVIAQVSGGEDFALFLSKTGQVWSAGIARDGALGLPDPVGNTNFAQLIPSLTNVQMISAGHYHSLFLLNDGSVLSCGYNFWGALGLGDYIQRNIPGLIPALSNIVQISAGQHHSMFLTGAGTVWTCGSNDYLQLGVFGDKKNTPTIVPLSASPTNIKGIIAGARNSLFLTECPPGFSGPQCTSSVCYNISALDTKNVCTGIGKCVSRDSCVCEPPSSGNRCQFNVFYWRGPILSVNNPNPVSWSVAENWHVVVGNQSVESTSFPSTPDSIFVFDQPGPFSIVIDVPVTFSTISSGSSDVTLSFKPKIISGLLKVTINQLDPRLKISSFQTTNFEYGSPLALNGAKIIDSTITSPSISLVNVELVTLTISSMMISSSSMMISSSSVFSTASGKSTYFFANSVLIEKSSVTGVDIRAASIVIKDCPSFDESIVVGEEVTVFGVERMTRTFSNVTRSFKSNAKVIYNSHINGNDIELSAPKSLLYFSRFTNLNVPIQLPNPEIVDANCASESGCSIRPIANTSPIDLLTARSSSGSITIKYSVDVDRFSLENVVLNTFGTVTLYANISGNVTWNNYGQVQINKNESFAINLILENYGKVFIGNQSTLVLTHYTQKMGSTLLLDNSTLRSMAPLVIAAGSFVGNGNIDVPSLHVNSQDGQFRLPGSLHVSGNCTFSLQSTIVLNSSQSDKIDYLSCNGTLRIDAFVLILLKNPETKLLEFASYNNYEPGLGNLFVLGAPFRGASYSYGNNRASFVFASSLGNVENNGYRCHYLGKQKTMEMTHFDNIQKTMLAIIVPIRDGNYKIGFGFDTVNGSISDSILTIADPASLSTVQHIHGNKTLPAYDLAFFSTSPSFFELGGRQTPVLKPYHVVYMLVSKSLLATQKWIYFTQIKNQSHTLVESDSFSVLNGPIVNCTNFLKPSRAEMYNFVGLGFMFGIYAVVFILLIVFCRFRPLNTRGISPILTLLFLALQLLLEIRNYFDIPEYQGSLCVYLSLGFYPLQQIVYVLILLYFVRYFAIINLNGNKKSVYNSIQAGMKIKNSQIFFSRLLKVLASPFVTIGMILVSYLFTVIIFVIVLASYNWTCQFDTLTVLHFINGGELIIIYSATIISLIVDVIPNLHLIIRCQWFQYIIHGDPYWFRAQIILFLPFMIYSLSVEFFIMAVSGNYRDVVANFEVTLALNTISAQLLLILDCLFPLIMTFIDLAKKVCKRKVSSDILDQILNHPEKAALFVKFCESEFSLENIASYSDIQAYKKMNTENRLVLAKEIFDKYLAGAKSLMEINCPGKLCESVRVKIDQGELNDNLFVDIEIVLKTNLSDTFARFSISSQYEALVASEKKVIELIEGKNKI